MALTLAPQAPSRNDPENFADTGDDFMAWMESLPDEFNTDLLDMITAAESARIALQATGYKGEWKSLSGPLTQPACVKHNNLFWLLDEGIADVASEEPGISANWARYSALIDDAVIDKLTTIQWSQPEIYKTETMTGQITNYDSKTTYVVAALHGTVSVNNDVVTYTAPAAAVTDTLTINGRVIAIDVLDSGFDAPTILSPTDGSVGAGEAEGTELITTSAPVPRPAGSDTHLSTTVEVATDPSFSTVVKTETVTAGDLTQVRIRGLVESTTYYVRAKHTGSIYTTDWSGTVTFTTAASFIDFETSIGAPYGGGFVAGKIVSDFDSKTYGLIVSDGSGDSHQVNGSTHNWRTSNSAVSAVCGTPPMTMADGYANHQAIIDTGLGLTTFPAVKWIEDNCNTTALNGYTDWYLPSRDELELCYRNFKPTTTNNSTGTRTGNTSYCGGDGLVTGQNPSSRPVGAGYTTSSPAQTSIVSFETDGGDAFFYTNAYCSSSEVNASFAWGQYLSNGNQLLGYKADAYRVRAVRRVAL